MQDFNGNGIYGSTLASRKIIDVEGDRAEIVMKQNDNIIYEIDGFMMRNQLESVIIKHKRIDIGASERSDKYQYIDCSGVSVYKIFDGFDIKNGFDIVKTKDGNIAFLVYGQGYEYGRNKEHHLVETYVEMRLFSEDIKALYEGCDLNEQIENISKKIYETGVEVNVENIYIEPDIEEVFAIHKEFDEGPYMLYRIHSFDNPVIRKANLSGMVNEEKKEVKKAFDKFCKKYNHDYRLVSYEKLKEISYKAQKELDNIFTGKRKVKSR